LSQNRRSRKRVNLSFYLIAKDAATSEALGNIVDITPAGFLLLSAKELVPQANISVNIDLPEPVDDCQLINCICEIKRCRKSANPDFYEVGFDITYASSQTKLIIEHIQQKWELRLP